MEKIDVAVNIFAKPFRTALSLLSLIRQCGQHIGTIWLQFEPMGINGDSVSSYAIYEYIQEKKLAICKASQPEIWLARQAVTEKDFSNPIIRLAIRYQYAFENSTAPFLFLMHNDVFILRDILAALMDNMEGAFAIGQLGQCWNCPAAHSELTRQIMACPPCTPDAYLNFRPTHEQLRALYAVAKEHGIFARPYQLWTGEFATQPWPLPECRINEWACLINLQKTRPLCAPFGTAFPPGAYRACGEHNLDIGVPWFRDLHAHGLTARNFDLTPYMKHWVGTGKNTPIRHAKAEDNAYQLLRKHFGDYVKWLEKRKLGTLGSGSQP